MRAIIIGLLSVGAGFIVLRVHELRVGFGVSGIPETPKPGGC
ncbi:hypothetical protein HMPREF0578_1471 [Mobiluncus mulieris 28-1]|nr:hypothetical protein HMPREF0578_1471 [Mobiluncus mulieris 28-1]EFN94045.1 hypothetical protein HMPREF9278_0511 [Mobiluncus mulieris FB024-16]